MPNGHGQVTTDDFKAPAGKFRIMSEDMRDGALRIITDINHVECAMEITVCLRRDDLDEIFIFTLCDDQGTEIEVPVSENENDEPLDPEDGNPPWE